MAADYAEANDGTGTGNDMVDADFTKTPSFAATASTTDAPEPTALTVDTTKNLHVTGSSAALAAGADQYLDRDTYEFTTGAATKPAVDPPQLAGHDGRPRLRGVRRGRRDRSRPYATSTLTANAEDEFQTFAVKPSTKYWLWVGAYKGSTGAPTAYDASLCGSTFTP